MTDEKTPFEWRVIGETVPGASHIRAGIPNQDSILYVRESSRELPIIVSIADGHGSAKCFRSDLGSQFAVRKATQIVGEFLDERRGNFDSAEVESKGGEYLPQEFVKKWRKTVEYHLKNNPFTEDEFIKLEEKSGTEARKLVEKNPLLAYGTTSLTVALEDDFVLYMQLGDGDILNVAEAGGVTKPLPEDARLLANETTSLCLEGAEKDFRFFVQNISDGNSPQMILLSTDGYLNSFASEAGFFQAGTDILQMLRAENGFNDVNDNLKMWLAEATEMGSGDDCTIAVIYRLALAKQAEKTDEVKTTVIEAPLSAETSRAIAVLTGSERIVPEDLEDVTMTITIKKSRSKVSKSSSAVSAENGSAAPKTKADPDPEKSEKE